MDETARKLMINHPAQHARDDNNRHYVSRKDVERVPDSTEDCVEA